MQTTDLAHCVSSLCSATPDHAFTYLSDPRRLGEWSLGCWGAEVDGAGAVRGTSLFDGAETVVEVIPLPEHRIVDYAVGDDPGSLVRRISARVVPGDDAGGPAGSSLLVLTAWREKSMDDLRWRRLVVAHEAEIHLLRHRIERSAA
jgi:hypothetical protein